MENNEDIVKDIQERVNENILNWDDETYFNDRKYLTNSMLSKIAQGGVQHLQAYLQGKFEKKKHNIVGNHFHTIVLEPHLEEEKYFVIDDRKIMIQLAPDYKNVRATKKYKEWLEAELEKANGRDILEWEDYDNNCRMKDKLMTYPAIRELIKAQNNVFEKVFHGKDREFGIPMKCKVDIRNYGNYLADLKSTKDPVTITNCAKIIKNYGYDRQAANYLDITGEEQFYFIFVEKSYPYTCGIIELYQETIDNARKVNKALIGKYMQFFGDDAKASPEQDFVQFTL